MTVRHDRAAVAIAVLALLVATIGAALATQGSSADFVVTTTSPANQAVTLDPQPPATFAVPVSEPAGAVRLTWTASATAALRAETTYSVHRSPAGAGTYAAVASGLTALTYTDTPPADGTYDYRVRTDVSSFNADSTARSGLSDRLAPTISGAGSPAANANGWRKADTTVTFTCGDGGSGVASCTAPVSVTTEGAAQAVPGSAADGAGNTASTSVSVSLDKTAPGVATALATSSGSLGGAATVNVSWTAAPDGLSGVGGYTLRWTSAAVTCPAVSTANYPNAISIGTTSPYVFTGAALTSYCFYLVAIDLADNVGGNSANSGAPRLAQ